MFWPMPSLSCDHDWKIVGPQYSVWAANGTGYSLPPEAPLYVNCVCMKCGGYDSLPVTPNRQPKDAAP